MKNKKMIMVLAITLMTIGFASVSTVLYLNGQTFVASNTGDFDVYFSKATENGVEKKELIKDKQHIEFTTNLSKLDEIYELKYEVTNASKNYDVSVSLNVPNGNEYVRVTNDFDTSNLLARTSREGTLTLTVIKGVTEEISFPIKITINVNAVERSSLGENSSDNSKNQHLRQPENYPEYKETFLGYTLDRSTVETITFVDNKKIPEVATMIGDVSETQNGSVMMYSKDEDNDNLLEIYIGQDGGVVANPDLSQLFYSFTNLTAINGLDKFDTSNMIDMSEMFGECSNLASIDLKYMNTSNVTTVYRPFFRCTKLTELDLSNFDTSNITTMTAMFVGCKNIKELDVSHFNTSKVTDMESMFYGCSSLTNLDLSTFDTSKVTSMRSMFDGCTNLETLDVSGFDMRNVSITNTMFYNCSKLTTTITIRGINCTSYMNMFASAAKASESQITVNYTADASDLVDQMIETKSYNANVVKGSVVA